MKIFENASNFVEENKSTLLTGAGIGFGILSVVSAIKATKRAVKRIDEAGKDISVKDKFKIYVSEYATTMLSGMAAIGCILGGKTMDLKSISKLTVVNEAATRFAKTYSKNVEKQLGKEKNEDIKKKSRMEAAPNVKPTASEVASLLDGDQYFMEPYSGKKFASSTTKIENAVNVFNDRLNNDDEGRLYDIWDSIIESTPAKMNSELIEGQINQTFGFVRRNGLIAVEYGEPQTGLIGGNKISYIPIIFVDQKTGRDRDPMELYEEGRYE